MFGVEESLCDWAYGNSRSSAAISNEAAGGTSTSTAARDEPAASPDAAPSSVPQPANRPASPRESFRSAVLSAVYTDLQENRAKTLLSVTWLFHQNVMTNQLW